MSTALPVGHETAERPDALEPQAAAELAQELALVSKALFAQLLPETPMRAIAGVGVPVASVVGTSAPVSPLQGLAVPVTELPGGPAARPPEPPDVAVGPSAPMVAVPVTVPVPAPAPVALPVPIPTRPANAAEGDASEGTPAPTHKPAHLSLAMLEEIGFLDE